MVYLVSTSGGPAGLGQVFEYQPRNGRRRVLCEDGSGVQFLHGLTTAGEIFPFAANNVVIPDGVPGNLDRAAALAWPLRRAAHIIAIIVAVISIVAATALTGDRIAPAGQIVRDAIGMGGLLGLGAATLGASRAWIPPLTWTVFATYRRVFAWMFQPAETTPTTVTALILGASGVLAYAILGPRP